MASRQSSTTTPPTRHRRYQYQSPGFPPNQQETEKKKCGTGIILLTRDCMAIPEQLGSGIIFSRNEDNLPSPFFARGQPSPSMCAITLAQTDSLFHNTAQQSLLILPPTNKNLLPCLSQCWKNRRQEIQNIGSFSADDDGTAVGVGANVSIVQEYYDTQKQTCPCHCGATD